MGESEYISTDARDLISPQRFDLLAKYTYVKFLEKGYDMRFAEELYRRHIEAFSGGSFQEPGKAYKNSSDKYVEYFNLLIRSLKEKGFDQECGPIPVSSRGIIGDGAHRTAACAYLDVKALTVRDESNPNYNYAFFREMYLDEKYLDYIASMFITDSGRDCHVLILWPAAFNKPDRVQEAVKRIDEAKIVYRKKVSLSYNGLRNFMIMNYADHGWSGSPDDHYKGIYGKLDPCFAEHDTEVFVLMCSDEEIVKLKKEIRDIIGIENHSCHSSDTHEDAVRMGHLLLNANSIFYLNHGDLCYDVKLLKELLEFRKKIEEAGEDREDYVIVSSAAMALCGLRQCGDVDYIAMKEDPVYPGFDCDNEKLPLYGVSLSDLIMNPDHFGYIFDLKVISLDLCRKYKEGRGSDKDKEDIQLINHFMSSSRSLKSDLRTAWINTKRNLRNVKTGIRDTLEKRNIRIFTKIWHLLRGKGFK